MTERTHRCTGSVSGKHLFGTPGIPGICYYCAIDVEEIRHLLTPQEADPTHFDPIDTEKAIQNFFKREGQQ